MAYDSAAKIHALLDRYAEKILLETRHIPWSDDEALIRVRRTLDQVFELADEQSIERERKLDVMSCRRIMANTED